MNRIAFFFYAVTVGLHIAWPLSDGPTRTALTLAAVATLTIGSLSHLMAAVGIRKALTAAASVMGIGWLAEVIGINTAILFGHYSYGPALQPQIAGVPLAVVFAWFMMAWPFSALVTRWWPHAGASVQAAMTGALLTAWDLFLDPQMVGERYWTWREVSSAVPGTGIPVGNYLWWFVVGSSAAWVMLRIARPQKTNMIPVALILGWSCFGGVVGNLFYWNRPEVAAWGGLAFAMLGGILALRRNAQ